jgi:hypothetical protein
MTGCLSRRAFVSSLAAGAAGLARAADPPKRKYRYIDDHVHLGTFYWGKELTVDGLLRLMDKNDIEKAVVLPLVSPEAGPYPQTTEAALAAHKAYPDRIVPFCCLDPRCVHLPPQRPGHVVGLQGMKDILKRYQDRGAKGLGEHKVGLPFDQALMMMLYESCQDLYLPVLFHLDDIRSFDTPGSAATSSSAAPIGCCSAPISSWPTRRCRSLNCSTRWIFPTPCRRKSTAATPFAS